MARMRSSWIGASLWRARSCGVRLPSHANNTQSRWNDDNSEPDRSRQGPGRAGPHRRSLQLATREANWGVQDRRIILAKTVVRVDEYLLVLENHLPPSVFSEVDR